MWFYSQATGKLNRNGTPKGTGYSGRGVGCNNSDCEQIKNVGPIPQGGWVIGGPPIDTHDHGPYVLHLVPNTGTETFGRGGFLIHGDNVHAPGTASEGCMIFPRALREAIWESQDRELTVTP